MDEARFIQERENSRIITEASLLQVAVAVLFAKKKANNPFSKMVKQLNVEAVPVREKLEPPAPTEEERAKPKLPGFAKGVTMEKRKGQDGAA